VVLETRLKKLLFRSAHRGTKEADLLLGPYAEQHLAAMDTTALAEFEAFLEESDSDIWDWISGATHAPRYHGLIEKLRSVVKAQGAE
jgi:antitoxin CptB